MATEVNWSELPTDLLNLISQRIDNEIDLIRFQSTCSRWRTFSIRNHRRKIFFPFEFHNLIPLDSSKLNDDKDIIDFINNINSPFCNLSKRSLFLVKPPPNQTLGLLRPWLMQIHPYSHGEIRIIYPLIKYYSSAQQLRQTVVHCPRVLDFNKLSVLHLGTHFINDDDYMNPAETVLGVTCYGENPLLLGTMSHCSHRPVIFRGYNKRWTLISNLSTAYGDIHSFKGRFYVVDMSGRTVTVGLDSTVELVAQPLCCQGDGFIRKMLVESEGDLLLLDIYQSSYRFSIDFFKLDEKEKKWVKLIDFDKKLKKWVKPRNFRDRVFFLASGCSFSASASDLCLPKGNCVIFIDESVLSVDDMKYGNCVFHLNQDQLSRLSEYPEYNDLFLPPEWILKS